MSMENVSNKFEEAVKLAEEAAEAQVENTGADEQVTTDDSVNMKIEKPKGCLLYTSPSPRDTR